MEKRISELDNPTLKYLTTVFDKALKQVKYKLEVYEDFQSVEYEIYPSDADRITVTASDKKIREDIQKGEEDEISIPIVDRRAYSVSIENLRMDQNNILRGDVACFTWVGPLATTISPTEFYMADVKSVGINRAFEVTLSGSKSDIERLADEIFNATEECIKAVNQNS